MRLPFTVEQFLDVFARYNHAIWPAQLGAYALGLVSVVLALRGGRGARAVPFLLAGAWAFVGAGYQLLFFARVNPVATAFGAAFLVQAGLFGWLGLRGRLELGWTPGARGAAALALVAYAAVAYPLLGAAGGHGWPRAPMFGVAPCPTTIFTFGLLLLARGPVPAWLLVVPSLWALIGLSAALQLGIREDLGLLAAAVVALAFRPWAPPRAEHAAAR